jgi:hypothetical protein
MPVVPVLVEGAATPNVEQLPDSLKELVYRNGLEIDSPMAHLSTFRGR